MWLVLQMPGAWSYRQRCRKHALRELCRNQILRRRSVSQGAQRRGECRYSQHTDQHLTLAGVRSVADSRCVAQIADRRCCLADVPQRPWNAGLRLEGVREDGWSIEFACEQLDGPADGPCMIIAIMLPSV